MCCSRRTISAFSRVFSDFSDAVSRGAGAPRGGKNILL